MQRGNSPHVLFTPAGSIFAIGTGSSACSEHEWGSKPMMAALCGTPTATDEELIRVLRKGGPVTYPSLLERKSLNKNLDKLVFATGKDDNGQPVAVLGFSEYEGYITVDHHQLGIFRSNSDMAGAWDDANFALKVRGEELVAKLQAFYQGMLAGDAIFAGTFLAGYETGLTGVIVALRSGLQPVHLEQIAKAQKDWEAGLRLKAKSRLDEFETLLQERQRQKLPAPRPGYLWPVWRDRVVDGEVVYQLNPDSGYRNYSRGDFTIDELKKWVTEGGANPLKPVSKAA